MLINDLLSKQYYFRWYQESLYCYMNKSHYDLNLSLILHDHNDVNGEEKEFFMF